MCTPGTRGSTHSPGKNKNSFLRTPPPHLTPLPLHHAALLCSTAGSTEPRVPLLLLLPRLHLLRPVRSLALPKPRVGLFSLEKAARDVFCWVTLSFVRVRRSVSPLPLARSASLVQKEQVSHLSVAVAFPCPRFSWPPKQKEGERRRRRRYPGQLRYRRNSSDTARVDLSTHDTFKVRRTAGI